jgi:acyl-CoA synthetase (AMP-forming)/AMP-acid ligase II
MFKAMDKKIWEKNIPHWWPERFHYGKDPLVKHLYDFSWRIPDKPAIIFYGRIITYKELNDMVWKVAGGLQKLGINKGDRVYIALQNCPQFIIAYYAAAAIGAITITGSPLYKGGELRYVLNDCTPKVVIIEDDLFPIFAEIRAEVPFVEKVVVTSLGEYLPAEPEILVSFEPGGQGGDFPDTISWQELIGSQPITALVDLDIKKDIAMLQYTSGTTGNPKGAILTHFNILANATNSGYGRPTHQDDIHIAVLPLFHVNGSNNSLNAPILCGATIVLLVRFDLETMYQAIEKYRCSVWIGITTMNIAFLQHPKFKDYDLSSLTFIGTGGMPLPQALFNTYKEVFGVELQDGFGMSETMAYTICNSSGYSKVGSLGIPCPLVDIRLAKLDDETVNAEIGEEGELWQRGPSIAIGYWNNPEATAETFVKSDDSEFLWLKTGDIMRMDEEGFLWLCGRTKEMIKVSGYSVYPAEVDEYLYRHPAILECCAIGIPHDYKGEEVKAFVVLRPEYKDKVTAEEIIEWASQEMSAYKYPRVIEFRDTLPKGGTGKIMRKVLKAEEEKQE